ncbi:unnamed protein product, partial [Discosporangium mesarthrocarpum]
MQRVHLTKLVCRMFMTWRGESRRSRQMRKVAVGIWANHSLKELGVPFRLWYICADRQKRERQDHERLLRLFRRIQNRRTCHTIMRAWKHQSIYGRVEGLYTRPQLIASLAEQKEHSQSLLDKVDELAGALEDMEDLAMEYRSQMIVRQRETKEREASMDRQAMAQHHMEQEVLRMQSLLDAAATIAPHICEAVYKKSPDFKFENRGIEPFSKARLDAQAKAEEQRIQELVSKALAEQ